MGAFTANLQEIRDRILPVIHPYRTNLVHSVRSDGSLCAMKMDIYGGMGIVVVNVLGDLGIMTCKANKFVSFGLTLADSDMTGNGINFLPDAGGLNVLRHFIFDMCKVSGATYISVYWQLFRCCLRDMLADPSHPVVATLFIISEGSRYDLAKDEAMLHGDERRLLGQSICNTYQSGLEWMFTNQARETVRPSAPRNDDNCILYGIAFDDKFIVELKTRIRSIIRSRKSVRHQKVVGLSGVPGAMCSAQLSLN